MGGTKAEPEEGSWSQPNLVPILWTLKTLSNRLREVAATLVRQTQGKDASRTLAALQRAETKIWAIAGELLGVQKRLQAVGTEPGLPNASAAPQDVPRLKGAAELLAIIQCVIADRLEPAIDALVGVCRHQILGEDEPQDEPGEDLEAEAPREPDERPS